MNEISSADQANLWLDDQNRLPVAFQSIDLSSMEQRLLNIKSFKQCMFLGCTLSNKVAGHIVTLGGLIIGNDNDYQFDIHRKDLYTPNELFEGFNLDDDRSHLNTKDHKIYIEYHDQGQYKPNSIETSLARRLHDHSITDALMEFIEV